MKIWLDKIAENSEIGNREEQIQILETPNIFNHSGEEQTSVDEISFMVNIRQVQSI